jgi:hypothetical protein
MHAFHSIQSTEYTKTIPHEREYVYLLLLLARIRNNNTFIEEEQSIVGIYDSINPNKSQRMKECLGSNCQWILCLLCLHMGKSFCNMKADMPNMKTCENMIRETERLSSAFCCRSIQHNIDCLWTSGNTSWMVYGVRTLDRSLRATEGSKRLKARKKCDRRKGTDIKLFKDYK